MRKARNFIIFFTIITSLSAVTAFAEELPKGEWRLASYNFLQEIAFPIDKMDVTLNVNDGGKLGGRSGCNLYGGSFSMEGGNLAIRDLISTMMACEEPSMQFERLFNLTLQNATQFIVIDGILTITGPKTANFLRFERVDHSQNRLRQKDEIQ